MKISKSKFARSNKSQGNIIWKASVWTKPMVNHRFWCYPKYERYWGPEMWIMMRKHLNFCCRMSNSFWVKPIWKSREIIPEQDIKSRFFWQNTAKNVFRRERGWAKNSCCNVVFFRWKFQGAHKKYRKSIEKLSLTKSIANNFCPAQICWSSKMSTYSRFACLHFCIFLHVCMFYFRNTSAWYFLLV